MLAPAQNRPLTEPAACGDVDNAEDRKAVNHTLQSDSVAACSLVLMLAIGVIL
jgi:hypothetical protein